MEEKVFRRVAVATELRDFVEARLHTDHADAARRNAYKELQRRASGSLANPAYVAVDPATGRKLGVFLGATLADDAPFARFLQAARDGRGAAGEQVLP
ncbi:MAG: hypothetical protein HY812_12730 [Planctomycetes bacterium]|nr:hypothetical protein [Planctomycetota bacterium]